MCFFAGFRLLQSSYKLLSQYQITCIWIQGQDFLRNEFPRPAKGVAVELCCGVEPQVDPLLPVPNSMGKHVRLQRVRLAAYISQKLEVQFVMCISWGC